MNDKFKYSVLSIDGLGEKRAAAFKRLGVDTVGALLEFYPIRYENWSDVTDIISAPYGEKCCVRARIVTDIAHRRVRNRLDIYTFTASDGTGELKVTLFNVKYLAERLRKGEEYLFYGRVDGNLILREMSAPSIEPASSELKIRPVYRQTKGMTSFQTARYVRKVIDRLKSEIEDPLPAEIRAEYSLCHLKYAIENIHFPESMYALKTARRRFVFEELLYLSLGLMSLKKLNRSPSEIVAELDRTEEFFSRLPFEPTRAQRRAIGECMSDMRSGHSMNRLLQGDVGSGKTAVAACLIYNMAANGYQSVLIAPTEILAVQHFNTLSELFGSTGLNIELLTGSVPPSKKRQLKERLKSGETDIVVGTHALIQKDVEFRSLGLIVTDEQHRFGVAQRLTLAEKGRDPHVLVMSATPIPRTLALIIYSDLEISVLDELPKGRRPIETYVVKGATHRQRAYNYIKKHLDRGLQGYIVCPLVKENEDGEQVQDLKAAEEYYRRLSTNEFKSYRLGLLHGKMKAREKDDVMNRFASGELQLLISTVVIEVGVDVPSAVIILIENADRFGLSQLHQLRGRVGRGSEKSTCILLTDSDSEKAADRLHAIASTTDGFKIAEEDLKLRGPGNFFGYRQHGLPELKIADMFEDTEVLGQAKRCAESVLGDDPSLETPEHRELRRGLNRLFEFDGIFAGKSI